MSNNQFVERKSLDNNFRALGITRMIYLDNIPYAVFDYQHDLIPVRPADETYNGAADGGGYVEKKTWELTLDEISKCKVWVGKNDHAANVLAARTETQRDAAIWNKINTLSRQIRD